jgi:hypothetical protein
LVLLEALEKMFHVPAPIIFVTGRMGKGKTNFSLLLCELALINRWVKHVATNIKVEDPRFLRITSFAELESWLKVDRRKKLFDFDEASSNISRRTPLAKLNRQIIDLAFKLRKYRAYLVIVAVSRALVDSTFEAIPDLVLGEFKKISRDKALLTSPIFDDAIILHNIPSTTVKFDTYDIAPFTLAPPENQQPQLLCCRVAKRYAEIGNMSVIANEFRIPAREQVKILIRKHIQHTIGQQVKARGEGDFSEVITPNVEVNISAQMLTDALERIKNKDVKG